MKRKLIISLFTFLLLPLLTLATEGSETKTFATIPFLSGNNLTTQGFVTALYQMAIGLAAVLVVIRLIMAGAKYMLSEVVSSKGQAKEDIQNALLGLVIILAAVLILGTINPKLVGLNILNGGSPVTLTPPKDPTPKPGDDVDDQVKFMPGTTRQQGAAERRCERTTGSSSGGQFNKCMSDTETALGQSCEHNDGTYVKDSSRREYRCDVKY